ncbi:MAG TPA: phosphoribosylformylglycinamidine synthase subunit PurS [Bacillus bacterium]|nr:phosphoribosylformylglycinamidine synthase subunit PurS [Bacillus sp. (in: firmicutes)]
MLKVKVYVTLRESVIDPQGAAVKNALQSMSYNEVADAKVGKYIELTLDKGTTNVDEKVKEMCERLLVNANIENYRYDIEEVVAQ